MGSQTGLVGARAGLYAVCNDSSDIAGAFGIMTPSEYPKDSQATYSGFIGTLKWAIPVIAVIVLFVILIIS